MVPAAALLLAACYQQVTPPREVGSRSFIDDTGRTISVPEKVNTAVSLAPNLTEIVFAVGGGPKLIGVTSFCDYPAEAKAIKKVSDTQKPNIETIVALKPDVVFVSTASQMEAFTRTLDQQRIAVFVSDPHTLDDIYRSIEKIGDILGDRDRAAAVVDHMKKRAAGARRPLTFGSVPKVFVQIDKDPLYTVGRDSYITDIVRRAGGMSTTADVPTAYPNISRETAMAMNPDVIILSDNATDSVPNDAFRNSPAVKNGRVFRINADLLSRPGPRVIDALEEISEKLRPLEPRNTPAANY